MVTLVNRAKMTTATTGTGTITLGVASDGFQSFAVSGVADGDVVRYVIEDGDAFEIGTGVFDITAGTLTRNPSESSIGGGLLTLTGEATVFVGATAEDLEVFNFTFARQTFTATAAQTTFAVAGGYDAGFADVFLNGVKLVNGVDVNVSSGTNVVLTTGATENDTVDVVAYGAFSVADTYTQSQSDARFLRVTNNLSDLDDAAVAVQNLGVTATAAELNKLDGLAGDVVGTSDTQTLTNKALTSPELTGEIYLNGSQRGNVVAVAALDIDVSAGNYFTKSIGANSTFTFSGTPASRAASFMLRVTVTGDRTITFPASVEFSGNVAPTLTAGKTHLFMFTTDDGGTTFRGAALADYEA